MTVEGVSSAIESYVDTKVDEVKKDNPWEVEMISGNNGRNVQGALEGHAGGRQGEGFENSQKLSENIRENGLESVIERSTEKHDLTTDEVRVLNEFKSDIEAGRDAAQNGATDETALMVDDEGLIARVANHSDVASQIDGAGARDLGGGSDHNTVNGNTVKLGENDLYYEIKSNQFWSPLAMDLEGDGIDTTNETTRYDINGDGSRETVNDVDDAILAINGGDDGSELLGNNTDLGLGKSYDNGFDALHALGEKHGLVGGEDQVLDNSDIDTLERELDFGVKTDGYNSEVRSLGDVGVTQINLGEAGETQWNSDFDGRGNALETQEGATFVNEDGETNEYADVWHRDPTG
ncbi:MAG: hypothetical protein ACLFS2_02375 [Halochromatium sp.]|uniref:hypothetical protein n=1 Tax=Halochromatium sp. TaxID=2049430 RepID=UPI00397B47FD